MPTALKSVSRMASGQCCARYDNHGTLEDHEWDLLVEELAIESTTEFCYSKDASDEDGESRETQTLSRQLVALWSSDEGSFDLLNRKHLKKDDSTILSKSGLRAALFVFNLHPNSPQQAAKSNKENT